MNEKAPLTMKDIARELGISVSTVSRALQDSPRISAERRAMIQQFAREHNFTPNMLAETLRHSKVQPLKVIGVIIPEFTHFYFSSVLAGIEEEASSRGYRIMVALSDENYEKEIYSWPHRSWSVCGFMARSAIYRCTGLPVYHFNAFSDAPMLSGCRGLSDHEEWD
jgi:DNA-binding LacI/PurR family transcriptional regulator